MSLYGRLFAALYDRTLAVSEAAGLRDRRAALLAQARGRTLEVGVGTGLNLSHYGPAVTELTLAEPEAPMARRLRDRAASAPAVLRVVEAPAERLPFADGAFDTVVSTLVLCTVADPRAALGEIRRVLAPGGQLLFLEHVRAEDPAVARRQDLLEPLWRRVAHGCRCNRDTARLMAEAGLRADRLERGRIPKATPIIRPSIEGVARAD